MRSRPAGARARTPRWWSTTRFWASPSRKPSPRHARQALRTGPRGAHRGRALVGRHQMLVHTSTQVCFAPLSPRRDPRLLGKRRAARQGGRLCHTGAGRRFRHRHLRHLYRRDGSAALRNRAPAASRRAFRCGAESCRADRGGRSDDGNSHQRGAAREPRGARGKRRPDGAVHRAAEPARHRQQPVQGPRAARAARHAGRVHRRRPRTHRVPARRRHRGAESRKHAGRDAERRGHPRPREGGRRHPGAGGQGPDGHQGRAPNYFRGAAIAPHGLHAARRRHRRVGAHRRRSRARAPEGAGEPKPCRSRPPADTSCAPPPRARRWSRSATTSSTSAGCGST